MFLYFDIYFIYCDVPKKYILYKKKEVNIRIQ